MFVTRLRTDGKSDRGGALMAVLALTGVTAVIAVTVGTVTVSGLQNTNSTAAAVEARAAADAGIVAAELALRTETGCEDVGGVFVSAGAPAYRVTTQHDIGGGWVDGCPPDTATLVRFISEGFPERPVIGPNADNFSRSVEAVFQHIPEEIEIPQIDPAVYAYSIQGTLKKFQLSSADQTIAADLQIKTGDFECSNNALVAGDVILGNGTADLTACTINGTLHTSRWAAVDGKSIIRDDLIAVGNGVASTDNTVYLAADSQVGRDVFSGGSVRLTGSPDSRILGNLVAARDASIGVTIDDGSRVAGNVLSSGTLASTGTVNGTRSSAVVGLNPPPLPSVADWVDIPWNGNIAGTSWANEGFVLSPDKWTGSCVFGNGVSKWSTLSTYLTPTVIDATGCIGGVVTDNNLKDLVGLQTDIAIIADSFYFDRLKLDSGLLGNGPQRKIYFIVPDNTLPVGTATPVPHCTGEAGDITQTNEADIRPKVSVFFYTPCRIYSDRNGFRGQLYGGEVEFGQQAQLTFVPTSPPGIDFSVGVQPVTQVVGGALGQMLSIREVSTGG